MHLRLKSARIQKGLKQAEVASALSISQGMLSRIESGDKGATPEMLSRLAALYGVSESYLKAGDAPDTVASSASTLPLHRRILAAETAAPGLRALAADEVLVAALAITPAEWQDLNACNLSFQASKSGYVMLLTTLRAMVRA
jgi:transcriptional regulator with XRE-family HTH domain